MFETSAALDPLPITAPVGAPNLREPSPVSPPSPPPFAPRTQPSDVDLEALAIPSRPSMLATPHARSMLAAAAMLGVVLAFVGIIVLSADEAPLRASSTLTTFDRIEIAWPPDEPPPAVAVADTPAPTAPERPRPSPAAKNATPAAPVNRGTSRSQFLSLLGDPTQGRINASSNRTCKFWLNGSQRGLARGTSMVVPPGIHTVTCRLESGPYRIRRVKVSAGDKVSIGFRF